MAADGAWDVDPAKLFAGSWSSSPAADDFGSLIRVNGIDIELHECAPPSKVSQIWRGFAGFPRGFAAALLQVCSMAGLMGRGNEARADIRNDQLCAILYEGFKNADDVSRVVWWLVRKHPTEKGLAVASRMAGAWFTSRAFGFNTLPGAWKFVGAASNAVLAGYGSAILKIHDGDKELTSILGAMLTGQGDFDLCIPLDQIRKELKDADPSKDALVAEALQMLLQIKEFAERLGRA